MPFVDWTKFELAMTDPRYLHGVVVFRDEPRMPVQAVLDNLDDGITPAEIASAYQIEIGLVTAVKNFAESQRSAHSVQAIQEAILELNESERHAIALWLNELEYDSWDWQMVQDFSPGGRGSALVDKVRSEIAIRRAVSNRS